MAGQEKSLYSQGLNFGSYISDGVDPRTGQFTCSIALFKAPTEARNCPPINLNLSYDPLNIRNVGFGIGWSLNLSSYMYRLQSPTLYLSTGEHFQVDSLGDFTIKDKRLESFNFYTKDGGSCHQIVYKSGLIETLSNSSQTYDASVPVELRSSTGQSLTLSWQQLGDDTPQLAEIKQGSSVLLKIEYTSTKVLVKRAPDTPAARVTVLTLDDSRLTQLLLSQADAPKQPWQFTYKEYQVKGTLLTRLTRVTNPAKLVSEVEYDPEGLLLPAGAPMEAIPRVSMHTMSPGNDQPDLIMRYTYSPENFFGHGEVQCWKEGVDNLYRTSAHYQYSATSTIDNGPSVTYTYNKFHLLVETKREQGVTVVKHGVEYNVDTASEFNLQKKSFQLPIKQVTTYEDHGKPGAPSRSETTEHEYDDWGNPISETDKSGVRITREYYPPQGVGKVGEDAYCPADPGGFCRYIQKETVHPSKQGDLLPAPTQTRQYKYLQLPTVDKQNYFVAVGEMHLKDTAQDRLLLSTTYDYHKDGEADRQNHGRLKREATALAGQKPSTMVYTYGYNMTNSTVTKSSTTTTWDGEYTPTQDVTYCLGSGQTMAQKSAQGVTDLYEYDEMDRMTKTTAASGTLCTASRLAKYELADVGSGSTALITDSKGIKARQTMDGLGRVLRVEKQADVDDKLRVVEERTYNKFGQCSQIDRYDWASGETPTQHSKTEMEYDDWGNVRKTTTSSAGSVLSTALSVVDPVSLTRVQGFAGQGMTRTTSNLFGAVARVDLLRKDSASDAQPYSTTKRTFDALGRLVKEEDHLGHSKQYQHDDFGRVKQTTWPDGSVVTTAYEDHTTDAAPVSIQASEASAGGAQGRSMGERSLDGLSRVVKQTVGGRAATQTYDGVAPAPSSVTAPGGDTKTAAYNVALGDALTKLESPAETSSFDYDKQTAALLHIGNSNTSTDYKYLSSGLLTSEDIKVDSLADALSTTASYSLDGSLMSYTNVHGQEQSRVYDGMGRLTGLKQGSLQLTLVYDLHSRLASSHVTDEGCGKSVEIQREYDEFGREFKRTILQGSRGANSVVRVITQSFNALSLVTERSISDGGTAVLRSESFAYDECRRLVRYQCGGSQPPIDEKGNKIKVHQFVFGAYDNISQVTTTFQDDSQNKCGFSYSSDDPTQLVSITNTHSDYPPKRELVYDKNGRLVQDEQGRLLTYNSRNALIAVTDATTKATLSKYRYDASGRLIHQEAAGKSTYFFYHGSTLVAMIRDGTKISFLSSGGEFFAQTSEGGVKSASQLWATDERLSVLGSADADAAATKDVPFQHYGPYGDGSGDTIIGYNGQYRDPVTGWYHLGNGYRTYNPVLMRFHTPEPLSPFSTGEVNVYAYCQGDPINRTDPSGRMSGRNWAMLAVGVVVGILVSIATAGAGTAVEIGASIAAGAASDAVTGAAYDVANGQQPTLESIGMDAVLGAVGGAVGASFEAVGGLSGALRPITERARVAKVGWRAARINRTGRAARLIDGPEAPYKAAPNSLASRFRNWIRQPRFGQKDYSVLYNAKAPTADIEPPIYSLKGQAATGKMGSSARDTMAEWSGLAEDALEGTSYMNLDSPYPPRYSSLNPNVFYQIAFEDK